ncbi:hypothetical protein [Enterococcus wangshanyuanii]|uniref:Uncharacterized protein n=1 Tax=Enterococcus wangshanyuanii TaxID=2005703 RepID=A0ABQ1PER7_9ENTE|nr:hypothetical protein [Enterococcus wangshanyuanii]GGC95732.1 hypothetical protein GCM10011573_26790 [Enterococcus wangshanyuanii]
MDNLLHLGSESFRTTITNLQQKITFEASMKEPNHAVISLYKIQLADYQKKEKKRLQLIALQAKCVAKKNELQPDLDRTKQQTSEKIVAGSSHLEKITGSAGKMIEGNGGKVYAAEMNQIRQNTLPLQPTIDSL